MIDCICCCICYHISLSISTIDDGVVIDDHFFSGNISELNLKSIIMMPIIYKLNFALVVLTIISLSVWQYFRSDALGDFRGKPYLVIFSLFYFGAMIGLFFIKKIKNDSHSFLLSTMLILGGITSSLASLIPVILP